MTITQNFEFRCPQCGGHHFGRDTSDGEVLNTVQCHNASDGAPFDSVLDRIATKLPRQKACGWRGVWVINGKVAE